MKDSLPPSQQAIRDRCVHPTGTFVPFGRSVLAGSIPERFSQQAQRHPKRLAIQSPGFTFSYGDLDAWTDRVARALLTRGRRVGESIALLCGHDAAMPAAMLGVLKAGKVYVPLDPSYPKSRLTYMLQDSGATLLVTDAANRVLAEALAETRLQLVDLEHLGSESGTGTPLPSVGTDAPAVIFYTSGSTGQPKGFLQTHVNMLHDVMHYTNDARFCPEDRFALISSFSFADSLRTLYSALLNGASLFPFDVKENGLNHLADWLIGQEITVYRSVPTLFRHFCNTLTGLENFEHLRLIYLSGEPVYKRDLVLYRQHFPKDCILVNRLGTGEALTFRCNFIDHETPVTGNNVPVGYGVPDKEILLLDENGQAIEGVGIGEMFVKSRYLSPGYWNRPDLTEDTFLADPNGGKKRRYRTGDLGRLEPDGCLVHLGRKDFQVKIRGYRIEVAEIEMALMDHAQVEEALVLASEDGRGDMRLVAYLTMNQGTVPSVTALRKFLIERLPNYMIPAAFVVLDALPTTPSGKADRRSLPPLDGSRPQLDSPYVAPETPIERTLTGIWEEVLTLDQVGIQDDFIELGGNSLLAMQILSRVIQTFQVDLPLRSLLEASTVHVMALLVVQHQAHKVDPETLNCLLAEVEDLSEKQAQRLLEEEAND